MKFTARHLAILIVCCLLMLGVTNCTSRPSDPELNARPACVTIDSYSNVIEQVMDVRPDWDLLGQKKDGIKYRWAIEDESGKHTLSAFLTSDGCVCATLASSQFRMGGGGEETVGLFQGAAVAPVSDLDYTATWLEPKISFSCGVSYVLRMPYEAEKLMDDGTNWTLTCSRSSGGEAFDALYTLKIVAPACVDIIETSGDF